MAAVMVPASDHAPAIRSFDPADFPVPHGREEDWRFTPLPRLKGLLEGLTADSQATINIDHPDGVEVSQLTAAQVRELPVGTPVDRVSANAWAGTEKFTLVRFPQESVIKDVVSIGIHTSAGVSFDQVVIDVGALAEATVVVHFTGTGVFAGGIDLLAGASSRVIMGVVHNADRDAVNVSRVRLRLDRDAHVRSSVISLGGDLVRVRADVEYGAPGGDAELFGLFFADAGQHHEHRVFVDHSQPHCRSAVTYKGALDGAGTHTVWIGDVLVRANAIGIDTYEVNRNLVLSDGARADSVPNLELETGEVVGAGHASATGRFDDEQLFYLRSRGITAELARVLVVRGFFADILGRTGIPGLLTEVMSDIDARLGVEALVDVDLVASESEGVDLGDGS
jgi:Fe-S cluster assembly protein SufD